MLQDSVAFVGNVESLSLGFSLSFSLGLSLFADVFIYLCPSVSRRLGLSGKRSTMKGE